MVDLSILGLKTQKLMNNKNILITVVIVLAVIIVILTGFLLWPQNKKQPQQNVSGIQITSPISDGEIASPFKITGSVTGDGWTGFEGQVGTVKLLDSDGKELAMGILTATTDWMALPTNFETALNFSSDKDQSGTLVFHNENASGMQEKDKEFSLPVKIKKSSGETMTVKAYFGNGTLDPDYSCNKVFAVERKIPKTGAVATAAMRELLNGPTDVEKKSGYFTSINSGVKVNSISILKTNPPSAVIDFDEQLEFQVGGSCRVAAIRAQITETLKQFPTIESVTISINGRTEDILQP